MNPDIIKAIFPVTSEWLALQLDGEHNICSSTTTLELRIVVWELDKESKARTVCAIYQQETRLLPEDAVEPNQERVENYLLALGLTLERILKAQDTANKAYEASLPLLLALEQGFGNNHPLLLAKAKTVEDFTKALETKGRLGRWL